jgi:hypothetical protein
MGLVGSMGWRGRVMVMPQDLENGEIVAKSRQLQGKESSLCCVYTAGEK